jgi:hypothetical protein
MTSYTTFDANIQCDELNAVSEAEYDEVMRLMAEESEASEGYEEWSEEVEKDWLGGYRNRQPGPKAGAFDI